MTPRSAPLAPLQHIMLRDSLESTQPGIHVEQLEILFRHPIPATRISTAWTTLLARTEVLRMAFAFPPDVPYTWQHVEPPLPIVSTLDHFGDLEKWLESDRQLPLLFAHSAPWRVTYAESEKRLIWTFHHALLDGRSITAIIRRFLHILATGHSPTVSHLTRWIPPDAPMLSRASKYFESNFQRPIPDLSRIPCTPNTKLGIPTLETTLDLKLERLSNSLGVSHATLLLWAWAQALASASRMNFALIEQVRCGSPQHPRLGFSMNTLPLRVPACGGGDLASSIQNFRKDLLFLRSIETISPTDLPSAVQHHLASPWASVAMIEHSSVHNLAASHPWVRSIQLHESATQTITASAFIQPQIRLKVEGPANHELMAHWVRILQEIA